MIDGNRYGDKALPIYDIHCLVGHFAWVVFELDKMQFFKF
jgi:hypothetical protein